MNSPHRGDRSYSSWSLRGWLFFEKFGIPVKIRNSRSLHRRGSAPAGGFRARLAGARRSHARGRGDRESIAILETLAERHPGAGLWPEDAAARIAARYMVAEMHAGFGALRGDCAMNLLKAMRTVRPATQFSPTWRGSTFRSGRGRATASALTVPGFSRYTAADAFFAPVATRIATYNLLVSAVARAYVAAHLADPSFRCWRAMGQAENLVQPSYYKPFAERPGPARAAARRNRRGALGQCRLPLFRQARHAFPAPRWPGLGVLQRLCRDKTLHDPEACRNSWNCCVRPEGR